MPSLNEIIIDPEFRDLLPSVDDTSRLRMKIELEGWSDEPITVWKGENILLDGHNRYAIWRDLDEDGGPTIREIPFASREAAFHWVVNNQCARRNLTPEQERYLLGRKYTAEKKCPGGDGSNQYKKKSNEQQSSSLQPSVPNKTARAIGGDHGVSHGAVISSEQYADAVDAIDKAGVVPKADILSGTIKPTQKAVKDAAKLAEEGKIDEAKDVITKKPKRKTKEDRPARTETSEATEHQHATAVSASQDALNLLQRSRLVRLSKNNPSRDYAFDEVIKWLRAQKKAT